MEDVVGQFRFDLADAILREIGLAWFCRPRHHVDVGMVTLIVEGGDPAEVAGRGVHGLRDFVAVSAEEVAPLGGVVIAQALSILALEGNDVCPDVASVVSS